MWGGNQHHRLASTDRRADRFIPFFCAWPQVCFVNPDANLLSFQVGSQAGDELLVSMRVGEKDKHLRLIHSWLPSFTLSSDQERCFRKRYGWCSYRGMALQFAVFYYGCGGVSTSIAFFTGR